MSTTDPTGATPNPAGLLKRPVSADDARFGDNSERRLAWAREMERAQLDSWFKPMLAAPRNNEPEVPRTASAGPMRGVHTSFALSQPSRRFVTVEDAQSSKQASHEIYDRSFSERERLGQEAGEDEALPQSLSAKHDVRKALRTDASSHSRSASQALSAETPSASASELVEHSGVLPAQKFVQGEHFAGDPLDEPRSFGMSNLATVASDAQAIATTQVPPMPVSVATSEGLDASPVGMLDAPGRGLPAQVEISSSLAAAQAPVLANPEVDVASTRAGFDFALTADPMGEAPVGAQTSTQARGVDVHPASQNRNPSPVRLHEESTPKGQSVWIAMRADDATLAAMLPQWIDDLQRAMRSRGERLHQVVCNGQIVWRDGKSAPVRAAMGANAPSYPFMFDSINSKEA